MEDTRCIGISELADHLNIGRNLAYELANRSDFPKLRLGKRIVVPVAGLAKWLEAQTTQSGTPTDHDVGRTA